MQQAAADSWAMRMVYRLAPSATTRRGDDMLAGVDRRDAFSGDIEVRTVTVLVLQPMTTSSRLFDVIGKCGNTRPFTFSTRPLPRISSSKRLEAVVKVDAALLDWTIAVAFRTVQRRVNRALDASPVAMCMDVTALKQLPENETSREVIHLFHHDVTRLTDS